MISAHGGNGNQPWLFVADEENTSIHVHWSLDYGDSGVVKNWSTGCTVLAHARDSDRYKTDFRERWEAAAVIATLKRSWGWDESPFIRVMFADGREHSLNPVFDAGSWWVEDPLAGS